MKIVWLGQQQTNMPWLNDMRYELSKTDEVVAYGDGPEFIAEFDAIEIVKKEDPAVIMIGSNQHKFRNLDQINTPKAMKCSDPWANIQKHVEFTKANGINMLLTNFVAGTEQYQVKLPDTILRHLWFAIDPDKFKELHIPKRYDIACIGAMMSTYYPLRYMLATTLPEKFKKVYIGGRKDTPSYEEYILKINETRIFAFGSIQAKVGTSEIIKYAPAKWIEAMACGVPVACDMPDDGELIHFAPNENFIEISEYDYESQLQYYLDDNKLREKVASKGYEMTMKYHTIEIRTKQLKGYLEEIAR